MPAQREWRGQLALDAVGDARRIIHVAHVVQQNCELISTQSRNRIALAQTRFQAMPDRNQQIITNAVTKTVIHDLESIQIEKQHREHVFRMPLYMLDQSLESVEEQRTVRQPGERIVES